MREGLCTVLHFNNLEKVPFVTVRLISKCLLGVFKSPEETNEFFVRNSTLVSKKGLNQRSS